MKQMKLNSYAKINLGLQVLNKRPDSFHNINTVFTKIDLFDEITIEENNKLEVVCNVDLGIDQTQNLAYKAADKLRKKIGKDLGAKISIQKNIPFGGGLGGGSSNAATVLKGLAQLWDHHNENDMKIISQTIGSDVSYFLLNDKAIGLSRGEVLTEFQLNLPWYVLLVNPGIHVSTPQAYKELNRNEESRKKIDFKMILERSLNNTSLLKEYIINDFEKVVFSKHPEIKVIRDTLIYKGAIHSLMSGSGSSVFGLFETLDDALTCEKEFDNYFTKVTKIL